MKVLKILDTPHWVLPENIGAGISCSTAITSQTPYGTMNLASHVNDRVENVLQNRAALQAELGESIAIQWLEQVHGIEVFRASNAVHDNQIPEADGIYCREPGIACAVLTADCLPVLFCSSDGQEVAIAHAGWRGLVSGVLENTLGYFKSQPVNISCYLGPAIGPCHFEVGDEVREIFLDTLPASLSADLAGQFRQKTAGYFSPASAHGKWMADLFGLARLRLNAAGVTAVTTSNDCTFCRKDKYYSHRRNNIAGRFASLIWIKS